MHVQLKKFHLRLHRYQRRLVILFKQFHKHPVMVPVSTLLVLTVVTGIGFLVMHLRQDPELRPIESFVVTVSYDRKNRVVPTNEPTVGKLLKQLHIQLAEGDRVEPAADTDIDQDNFRINIYRAVPVEVVVNGKSTFSLSAATTPRSVARQAGVTVYPEDDISEAPSTDFLDKNSLAKKVIVEQATPVNVNLYGTPIVVRTHAKTVSELLSQKKIKLGEGDTVQPAPTTPLAPNTQVFLVRNGTQIATVTEAIPAPVETVKDTTLSLGTRAVRQQGSDGQRVVTYQIKLENGKEIGRTQIQSVVTVQPVTRITALGQFVNIPADKQAVMSQAGISVEDYGYVDYIFTHESHWNAAAVNGSGCSGLGQSCPGSKVANACANWQSNAVCQTQFFTGYANGRYGGWGGAYQFWVNNHYW